MNSEAPTLSSGKTPQTLGPLGMRLIWVMLLRIGLITALLGATLILNYQSKEAFSAPSPQFLLGIIAATYLITIVYSVWYRIDWAIDVLARLQLGLDLIFWGCLVYATGGIVSGFTFLFDLWLIVAAAVLGGRAAFYQAGASGLILSGLAISLFTGVLDPLSDQIITEISTRELIYFLGINIGALLIVATLVTAFVSRLEHTGKGLETERIRRADLAVLHGDAIRSLTVGLATTDTDGRVLEMNPAGAEILTLERFDEEGQPLDKWLPDLAKQLSDDKGHFMRGHTSGIRPDGSSVPLEYSIAPLMGSDGSWRGSIVVFDDLTEVKRLEAALEQSRQLAALGEVAASLAHEIRNPLSAVSGSFHMLADREDLSDEERSLLDIISRETYRMERLVSDMINYARPRPLEIKITELQRVIEEIVAAFNMGHEAKEKRINVDVTPGLRANVDRSQLRQVLWNLLRNACQVIEKGQRIDVSAKTHEDKVVIEVADEGPGIAKENIKKIFSPFFSTRELGLGLGLALCKRIIEAHRGDIMAEPRQAGGTIFRVTLPGVD